MQMNQKIRLPDERLDGWTKTTELTEPEATVPGQYMLFFHGLGMPPIPGDDFDELREFQQMRFGVRGRLTHLAHHHAPHTVNRLNWRDGWSLGMQDLHEAYLENGNKPVLLVGASLGGLLSVSLAAHAPEMVRGVLLGAPLLGLAVWPRIGLRLVQILKFIPQLYPGWSWLHLLKMSHFRKESGIPAIDQMYENLDLVTVEETLHPALDTLSISLRKLEKSDMPIFAFHGDQDTVTSADETARIIDGWTGQGRKNCGYSIVPGAGHDLLVTEELRKALAFEMSLWLRDQIGWKTRREFALAVA